MVQIVGKYQYVSSENFEEFMKALGMTEMVAAFTQSKLVLEVRKSGDQWDIIVNSDAGTNSVSFKLNEPYEEKLLSSDRKYKSVTTQEGNNFRTETQVADGVKIVRMYEFSDTGMKSQLSTNKSDVKATRIYKRL
ncbi:FABP-like protein [Xylocopa sonorina]|uniref:FABP-like protein n=1 Tax=Xylocopa sonorina TaxID=1818115 RepID=UPI00403AFA1E